MRIRIAITMLLCQALTPVNADPEAHFDCADAFELTRLATTLACIEPDDATVTKPRIDAAVDELVAAGFFARPEFNQINIQWCELTNAMGFVPNESQIFIDDGVQIGTIDLLAEVLAHEMIHVRQFRELGERGFKCDYVNAYIRCAACQDRRHALEREAYEFQDTVRAYFLARWERAATGPLAAEPASELSDPH